MQTSVIASMIKQCQGEKIVIADSSKIGKYLSFFSASLSDISCVITDSLADPEELERIREKGVRVDVLELSK